ncbi:hypothetical protein D921_02217 [Enterococcus faecalis F01966]|nr:hypothetical protein D921_02217 [Enterococcus faecalis F01966]
MLRKQSQASMLQRQSLLFLSRERANKQKHWQSPFFEKLPPS